MKEKQKKLLIILGVLLLLLIIVTSILTNLPKEEVMTEEKSIEIANTKIENKTINKLVDMNEEERMRFYLSEFIDNVELGNYEDAYEKLNSEFKDNYFKTFADFVEYSKSKFPKDMSIKYDNFERNGEIYIFWITLTNPITSSKDSGIEMNFVMKENDLNDYEMSFSVQK